VRRLAEGPAELPAEVRGREVRGTGECGHVERLAVAGIDEVLRAEEVPCRMDGRHRLATPSPSGGIFRFWRKRLFGSYRLFSACRRPNASSPNAARTRSIGSALVGLAGVGARGNADRLLIS
jgi:hypothetical protein